MLYNMFFNKDDFMHLFNLIILSLRANLPF